MADRTRGAVVPILDAEGLYIKSTLRSGLPGVSGATKGTLAWDPRGIVRAQGMMVEPQDASDLSHRVVLKFR